MGSNGSSEEGEDFVSLERQTIRRGKTQMDAACDNEQVDQTNAARLTKQMLSVIGVRGITWSGID